MDQPEVVEHKFPIVGLGASAGGVEALRTLVGALPKSPGVALVVVLHLPADCSSQLSEILARDSAVPVHRIEDNMLLERDAVFVVPPGRSVHLCEGRLRLQDRPKLEQWRPIDFFFESLAAEAGERAAVVVLSGTGTNGSLALGAIKEAAGVVLAQDPREAGFPDMPRNALATGLVDQIGTCAELAETITSWGGLLPHHEAQAADSGSELERALEVVRRRTGRDFSTYKRGTMERRILRRAGLRRCQNLGGYLALLEEDPHEVERLAEDLLIGFTSFFRDPALWTQLAEVVLPGLLRQDQTQRPLRIWVAGCAGGQEAYSMAILVTEVMAAQQIRRQVQIFATDIDQRACDRARKGRFPAASAAEIDRRRLTQHFVEQGEGYRIAQSIRDLITFAHHDLLTDPPFSHIDLVSCRNVLIYLGQQAQDQVLRRLHFALRPGGVLVLGSAETIQRLGQLYAVVDEPQRIYRRLDGPSESPSLPARPDPTPLTPKLSPPLAAERQHHLAQHPAHRHFAPAFVLVDDRNLIRYHSGDTERFLARPVGSPTDDLIALCDHAVRHRLQSALLQAVQDGGSSVVHYDRSDDPDSTEIEVGILRVAGIDDAQLSMVSFRERQPTSDRTRQAVDQGEMDARHAIDVLDQELRATRQELSGSIEELETSNEELKVSNEEIHSMYEELQSANEEMETSREELKAVNQELSVVNRRLHDKLVELGQARDVLDNLFASTNLPTLFLDRELRIQRFNPAAARLMHLIEGDLGRPMRDIADRICDGQMERDAGRVLENLVPSRSVVQAEAGAWHVLRTHPYRTAEDRIEGVVMTLTDITDHKLVEQELRTSEARHRAILDNAAVGIAELDPHGRIRIHNQTLGRLTGLPAHLLTERPLADCFEPPHDNAFAATVERVRADHTAEVIELPLRLEEERRWLRCSLSDASSGSEAGLVVIVEDITDQRQTEGRLEERNRALARSNDDLSHFASMASHDLQAPLRLVGSYLDLILELGDRIDDERRKRYFSIAIENVESMRRMITDMLDYARHDLEHQPVRTPSERSVATAIDNLSSQIESSGAQITVGELPVLSAPPRLLVQLFQNLLANAIDHSEQHGVAIAINATRDSERAGWIFTVSDDGPGMPPELAARVFHLFDPGDTGRASGDHGLGLPLCRKSLERIGGRIWCRSSPGRGSTFSFFIPDLQEAESPHG